ncbi:MAG: DNA mismatch repair protein MutS [SAR324 cluster bacterium]|nr:DNA mismatch repair protein MutS [SAR324 cluster bacterium]
MNDPLMDPVDYDKQTPMMQQFYRIKQEHPDKILFYRMGDFYEMFGDDAVTAAGVLQIQLTSRNKNKDNAVPLCGIPVHAYDQYLNKLTRAGFKVAVCEQTEDPAQAKGLVKREVVRIVTPGTIVASDLLDANQNSFLCAIWGKHKTKRIGIAFCDLSTGEFEIDELEIKAGFSGLMELLYQYQPKEILLPQCSNETEAVFYEGIVQQIRQIVRAKDHNPHIEYLDPFLFDHRNNLRILQEHFSVGSLAGFGIEGFPEALCSAGAVLNYLKETQKDTLTHILQIKRIQNGEWMLLDESTVRNLELLETSDGTQQKFTLLYLLDHCKTAMGSRKLRRWMLSPLRDIRQIEERLDQVSSFLDQASLMEKLRDVLTHVGDLERLIARIVMPQTHINDLLKLRESLSPLAQFKSVLQGSNNVKVLEIGHNLDALTDLSQLLKDHILPAPSRKIKEGGYIMPGVNPKLDELKNLMKNGKQLIANMEAEEKARTGISSLKIGYNRVFGYFIEISNASKHLAPDDYIRRQTLVNNERFVTESLKELEESILSAEDEAILLEIDILDSLKEKLRSQIPRIQVASKTVAEIDVLSTFAYNSGLHNYVRPVLSANPNHREIDIREGRHPVIESLNFDEPFIPNDVLLDSENHFIMVITGPNMGGKSTYMRQTALIALMAQMGSYVPALSAKLPVFDRIFTRVGASDNLTRGQSTFMVEMSEAASILNNATEQSLIVLDEIGRGTSTFDGISIAWAIIEHIHRLGALTLFATHYHELILLEDQLKGVRNVKVVVHEDGKKLVFLRKIIAGQTDKSYGIQVARLAGLPADVVSRAEAVVNDLKNAEKKLLQPDEGTEPKASDRLTVSENIQLSFFPAEPSWLKTLKQFDIDNHSPLEAMLLLDKIKKKIE